MDPVPDDKSGQGDDFRQFIILKMFGRHIWYLQSRFLLQQKQKKLLVSASIGFENNI
jgi:hypothetical protein